MKQILAVDDDQEVLSYLNDIFNNFKNYELKLFDNGKRALKTIENEHLDLVITAIDIDDVDGLDIINFAKKKQIPVIVLTSRVDEETIGMIKSYYKPDFYLKKPLERQKLINCFDKLFVNKKINLDHLTNNNLKKIFKLICNEVHQGIVLLNSNFEIIWLNNSLEKKGFLLQNVQGHKSYQIFDNKDEIDKNDASFKALTSKKIQEQNKKGDDGKTHHIIAVPVLDDSDSYVEFIIEFSHLVD